MALNIREREHVKRAQACAKLGDILQYLCTQVKEAHAEEFSSSIDNTDLLNEFSITTGSLNAGINQYCNAFINMWNNVLVTQREYGKDARGIISHNRLDLTNII